ncbi:MAG: hypothetical protein WBC71_00805 [Salaquimonas sp.]
MKTSIKSASATTMSLAIGFAILASSAMSASAAQSGAAQLRALMNSHVYMGQRFTQAARNATGDPHIQVIDRRHTFGEVYRCSYMFRGNPRYRYVECD